MKAWWSQFPILFLFCCCCCCHCCCFLPLVRNLAKYYQALRYLKIAQKLLEQVPFCSFKRQHLCAFFSPFQIFFDPNSSIRCPYMEDAGGRAHSTTHPRTSQRDPLTKEMNNKEGMSIISASHRTAWLSQRLHLSSESSPWVLESQQKKSMSHKIQWKLPIHCFPWE